MKKYSCITSITQIFPDLSNKLSNNHSATLPSLLLVLKKYSKIFIICIEEWTINKSALFNKIALQGKSESIKSTKKSASGRIKNMIYKILLRIFQFKFKELKELIYKGKSHFKKILPPSWPLKFSY